MRVIATLASHTRHNCRRLRHRPSSSLSSPAESDLRCGSGPVQCCNVIEPANGPRGPDHYRRSTRAPSGATPGGQPFEMCADEGEGDVCDSSEATLVCCDSDNSHSGSSLLTVDCVQRAGRDQVLGVQDELVPRGESRLSDSLLILHCGPHVRGLDARFRCLADCLDSLCACRLVSFVGFSTRSPDSMWIVYFGWRMRLNCDAEC